MPQNTAPIFTQTPDIQWFSSGSAGAVAAQNTSYTMDTGTAYLTFTGGPSGSYLQRIRFRPLGTNVQTVARVFINNGASTGSGANNAIYDEITLAATTAAANSALPTYELPLNFALPANYRMYVTLGTAVAAGYTATVIGGDY